MTGQPLLNPAQYAPAAQTNCVTLITGLPCVQSLSLPGSLPSCCLVAIPFRLIYAPCRQAFGPLKLLWPSPHCQGSWKSPASSNLSGQPLRAQIRGSKAVLADKPHRFIHSLPAAGQSQCNHSRVCPQLLGKGALQAAARVPLWAPKGGVFKPYFSVLFWRTAGAQPLTILPILQVRSVRCGTTATVYVGGATCWWVRLLV